MKKTKTETNNRMWRVVMINDADKSGVSYSVQADSMTSVLSDATRRYPNHRLLEVKIARRMKAEAGVKIVNVDDTIVADTETLVGTVAADRKNNG